MEQGLIVERLGPGVSYSYPLGKLAEKRSLSGGDGLGASFWWLPC